MTEPAQPLRRNTQDAFDTLVQSDPDTAATETPEAPPIRRRWILPAATALLAVLGAGALIAAALAPGGTPAATAPTDSPAPTSTPASGSPQPVPTIGAPADAAPGGSDSVVVSELADPVWVSRIAEAGNIPERALAAYAGAALAIGRTHPGCGLGWNTLAAIGHVESEHGTINGSRIPPDGVATPTIVGIPLDGTETAEIPDTDNGELDADTVWDRAVGPMQFIPETWAEYAQDGTGDGTTDINNIDDAALSAAVYLCTAGGDLTQSANWIAAITAYNPTVEYNNRVAEAANHYATLR